MSLNPCVVPVAAEDFDGDSRWMSIVNIGMKILFT